MIGNSFRTTALTLLSLVLLSACSGRDTYDFGQSIGQSKAECDALISFDEREKCEKEFAMNYETYQQEREQL